VERARELLTGLEALAAVLGSRLPDDLHDRRRNRRRGARPVEDLRVQHRGQLARERRLAVEQLVEDHAERVDVGRGVDGLALHLLRGHVSRRADHAPGRGQAVLVVDQLGDAEVEDLGLAAVGDQDVVGLHVPVDDLVVVRDPDRGQELLDQVDRNVDAEPPVFIQPGAHRAAVDPLHDDEKDGTVLVEVVDADDARVVQGRDRGRLAVKALAEAGVARVLVGQDLDRDRDLEAGMGRAVHHSHRAPPQLGFDRVAA